MVTLWCQVRERITKPPHIYVLFIIGGYDGKNRRSEVLIYDPEKDQWTKVGQLARSRSSHAMSIVPKETAKYCV